MATPLGHSLAGYAVYSLFPAAKTLDQPNVLLLCVIMAISPDFDFLPGFLLGSPARFLSADWVTRIPAVGPLFHWCEYIAMDPASRESRARAMAEVARSLASGTPVAIFPEGRIPDPSEGLAEFRPGAFRAALEAGVPIVPVVLSGTGRAWAPRTVTVEGRHAIHIRVLPAIHATPGSQAPAQLAAFVRAEMERAVATLR